ncbi:MAG TPA: UDP-N-acetylmuramoyl-L-alanyl-D-glutamate--2,6-diaminopimelate ligase [Candidatus Monoglobus merdigallinarum]|uniref:UDP-N-acetylmuramoyl-L-alanyl-D-glutamate--2,6-diaminopimelate ligase n=1 Tax=Candidatus Monoglobus merdigallinarum TaxID=2838698 RepID=A0A9D1PR54_9FIRM|nr:UDP-N-acetylmuramoyl-L-alanyl-D-glutamate--2,6-diaminopimelate ligase [Candidatus Monoglobus merdigallinarum]
MILSDLLKDVNVRKIVGGSGVKISGITYDSRNVRPGFVFVCITGFEVDGHKFARSAVENGAVAVVAEHELPTVGVPCIIVKNTRKAMSQMAAAYYDYPFRKFKLIGITGTNGKTTSTYLIKSILEYTGKKVGLIGTNQNMIGDTVIPTSRTTPDSLELMQLFDKMASNGADYVVMEVSSHALALDRVTACRFDVGAFTNITQDHLDFHKTMEEYLSAKSILFNISANGVINIDDSRSSFLLEHERCDRVITYGIKNECDLRASDIKLGEKGVEFDISFEGETMRVALPIPGEFSVYNAMTAIGSCLAAGISLKCAVEGLHSASGVKGRIEIVDTPGTDYTVIIDYAHTPDGLLNVLNAIKGFAGGRIVTLFGCGGDRDATKRPIMGKIAGELSDFCIVTSDNPRSEDPDEIIKQVLEGVKESGCEYVAITNRFSAIEYALDHAEKNDIILLAGKGHETYQVLGNGTICFDEREIVKKLLGCG